MDIEKIIEDVKSFILSEFLPGENPDELTESTELITHGILDSLATLKLVSFIEEQFDIALEAHEVDLEYLNTLTDIANLISSKMD